MARATLCQKTARRIAPAVGLSGCPPVATLATTMLWASIILPMTPPELLAAHVRRGERPSCSAVTFCRLPKRTLEEVSLPVSATPSQPMIGEKNGNHRPVPASARPIVVSVPLYFVVKPSAIIAEIVSSETRTRHRVWP